MRIELGNDVVAGLEPVPYSGWYWVIESGFFSTKEEAEAACRKFLKSIAPGEPGKEVDSRAVEQ